MNFNANIVCAIKLKADKEYGTSKLTNDRFDHTKLSYAEISNEFRTLMTKRTIVIGVQSELDAKSPTDQKVKDAKDLLKHLALTIELTIDKLFRDVTKIQTFVNAT